MEVLLKKDSNQKNYIQLPSKNNKNMIQKAKYIEIIPNNIYMSEQKPFSAPISSSPPNDFMNILKKRMDNYF